MDRNPVVDSRVVRQHQRRLLFAYSLALRTAAGAVSSAMQKSPGERLSSSILLSPPASDDGTLLELICFEGDLAAFSELVTGLVVGAPTTIDLGGHVIEGNLPDGDNEVR